MNDKKSNNSMIQGVGALALIAGIIFGTLYVFGNDRAGEVALASIVVSLISFTAPVIADAAKHLSER